MSVYVVEGWFGDQEWIEEIHATKAGAEGRVDVLWETRRSAKAPEYAQGVCKFAVHEYALIGGPDSNQATNPE